MNSRCRMLIPAIVLAVSGCQTTQQQDVAVNSAPNAPQVRSDASTNGIAATPARNSNDPPMRGSYDTAPVIGSAEQKISFLNGTGRFIGDPPSTGLSPPDKSESTVTLKSRGSFGPAGGQGRSRRHLRREIHGRSWDRRQGNNSELPQPVPRSSAIDLFQTALRSNNFAMINTGEQFKIVPADQAAVGANIRTQ